MSGPLLLGIAAVGVGWAYVTRDNKRVIQPITAAASDAASAASDRAIVANEDRQKTDGAAATIVADEAPIIGDIPFAGGNDGQVVSKDKIIEGNIIVGDTDKSTGGADPSVQATAQFRIAGLGSDRTPMPLGGNSEMAVVGSVYGTSEGLTVGQIADAYDRTSLWSGEVW